MSGAKERLVIIGSGWGGFELLRCINKKLYDVHIISPRNYFVFTPLLASTCTGTLEFRSVTEPIRRLSPSTNYHQATCTSIDLNKQFVHCKTLDEELFTVPYDKLVIAVGASSNTFGIPGVKEHAFFLKEIEDARRIRQRILSCFERAKGPNVGAESLKDLLHFAVVGGGPTGVEFAAELNDLVQDDLSKIYPDLTPHFHITVYDVGQRILGSFNQKLSEYASKKFTRARIRIATGTRIERVDEGAIWTGGDRIGVGMTVWATGLTASPLIPELGKRMLLDERKFRLLTDAKLNVFRLDGQPLPNVYALGDCGTIRDQDLPCTAQVALQKAQYLAKDVLNKRPSHRQEPEFRFANHGMMAYVGGWRAIADLRSGDHNWPGSGFFAWVLWRSAYLVKTVSWRNKLLIPMYWFLTWVFGRDISGI